MSDIFGLGDINSSNLFEWIKIFKSYCITQEKFYNEKKYKEAISIGLDACEMYEKIYQNLKENKLLSKKDLSVIENRFKDKKEIKNKKFESLKEISKSYEILGNSYKERAEYFCEKEDYINYLKLAKNAVIYNPNSVQTNYALANAFLKLDIKKASAEQFEKVCELDKTYSYGKRILGDLYASDEAYDLDKSTYYYKEYLKDKPDDLFSLNMYALNCYYSGYHKECYDACVEYLKKDPSSDSVIATHLLHVLKMNGFTQEELKKISEDTVEGKLNKEAVQKRIYNFSARKIKKDKLRIGYLSSDMKSSVVSKFLLPVIENHNKDKFELYLYSTTSEPDVVTEEYRKYADNFIECKYLSYKKLTDKIYEHKIDILVDLNVHTGCSRTLALAHKPAPVQAIWLGYPNTSGLDTIDYILTDKETIKEGEESGYTETPAYIEAGYEVFRANGDQLLELDSPPYLKNKYVTIGIFNATAKVTDEMIAVWAKIMKKTKTKILFQYITYYTDEKEARIRKEFKKYGIKEDRVLFHHRGKSENLFSCFAMADIALDTFPYSGTGTTIDCLLTGLPIICHKGFNATSRPTARILKSIGREELIADDFDEYIQKAVDLIKNPKRIEEYRKNLRAELQNSKLTDYKGFTKSLEETYQKLWDNFLKN